MWRSMMTSMSVNLTQQKQNKNECQTFWDGREMEYKTVVSHERGLWSKLFSWAGSRVGGQSAAKIQDSIIFLL